MFFFLTRPGTDLPLDRHRGIAAGGGWFLEVFWGLKREGGLGLLVWGSRSWFVGFGLLVCCFGSLV